MAADVASEEGTAAIIAASRKGVDILINNAGTGSGETVMDAPDTKWDQYWICTSRPPSGSPAACIR